MRLVSYCDTMLSIVKGQLFQKSNFLAILRFQLLNIKKSG